MAHAEKCPVCYGFGKLGNDNQRDCSGKPCHGCNGKGWVTVQDENVSESKMGFKIVNNPETSYDMNQMEFRKDLVRKIRRNNV
jgi:uncharacterized membrane protein